MSAEECKYQARDKCRHTKGRQRNLSEEILILPSNADKIKDKITEGGETGGSEKLEDSGLRKLRQKSGGF